MAAIAKGARPLRQYLVRGVPAEIDAALRERARRAGKSLNQEIVDTLSASTRQPRRYLDFSDIVGGWVADPAFDEAIAAQRQIDWEMWK